MMVYVGAAVLVVGFLVLLKICRLVDTTKRITEQARLVLDTVRSSTLSDRDKELRMQRYSWALLKLTVASCGGLAIALGLPYAVVWALDRAGWAQLDASLALVMSWPFLVATSVLVVVAVAVTWPRSRRT
jgi:hypothetical protein